MPTIDLLENSGLIFQEDIENLSPLKDPVAVKTIQVSYSSIAAACNTTKTNVMNCLKEIFSTMLYLIKQGNEISLDIKIGIVHVMNGNKLMFRNYNPEIKIEKKRNMSVAPSDLSKVPTSVATPMTNLDSTLSYRGQSQDVPARHVFNHVGIKRSGPAFEYNADLHIREGEKLFYRHKKNPYDHIDSFIQDGRFELEQKLQEIRENERQKSMSHRRKHRKAMSNSFHSTRDFPGKNRLKNYSANNSQDLEDTTSQVLLSKTQFLKSIKSDELNEKEPSSVNPKVPSKFVIDYPNFLKPAKYHPYRRLQEHHIADVLEDARKRHEMKLLNNKSEETKYTDMFFKSVEDNRRVSSFSTF